MTATGNPQHNPNQDKRTGKGRYHRTLDTAERDAEAARLYDQGWTYKEIAAHFDINPSNALRAVQRAVRAVVKDAGHAVLTTHISRLEYLYEKAVEIAETDHVMVSHGHIIYDDNGKPLRDHSPTLAAIREARASLESFRRLTGMDKPAKVEHSGGVKYEIVGVDPQELT